jgi:hypothetical protein
MAYKVQRPIAKNGSVIPVGTVVDAANWRNLRSLINGRYLVECAEPVVKARKLGSASTDLDK